MTKKLNKELYKQLEDAFSGKCHWFNVWYKSLQKVAEMRNNNESEAAIKDEESTRDWASHIHNSLDMRFNIIFQTAALFDENLKDLDSHIVMIDALTVQSEYKKTPEEALKIVFTEDLGFEL